MGLGWLLEATATAWATHISLVVSVIGLSATFLQARAAKRAASSATIAVGRLRNKIDLGQISYAEGQLSALPAMVESRNFAGAIFVFSSIRRVIRIHQDSFKNTTRYNYPEKAVRTIDVQLRYATHNNPQFNRDSLAQAIDGLAGTLATLQSKHMDRD